MRIELAPLEGVTDFPTRTWLALCGTFDTATTPFLRVTRDYPAKRIPSMFAPELGAARGAFPYQLIPQVMGSDPDDVARIAEAFLERGAPHVDLNCGCPAPTVFAHRAGSRLLECPERYHAFLDVLARRVGAGRMSLKMRVGIKDADAESPALFAAVSSFPWQRVAIHGRTREQGYKGRSRWDLIGAGAKRLGPIPVCGSGDVCSAPSFIAACTAAPGIQAVMVGRGAFRDPWLIARLKARTQSGKNLGQDGGTQYPDGISPNALLLALEAFARIQDESVLRPDSLLQFAAEGAFSGTCGIDAGRWNALCDTLARGARETPTGLVLQRGSLAKLKMLWNYLRSGLPREFFEPAPLRATSFGDFHAAVTQCAYTYGGSVVDVAHSAARDWIYSGEKADATSSLS